VNPIEDNDYQEYADKNLDTQDMEAMVANAEQEADMPQAIRHQLYIGWVLGMARANAGTGGPPIHHEGGNRVSVQGVAAMLVIPMPPKDWTL